MSYISSTFKREKKGSTYFVSFPSQKNISSRLYSMLGRRREQYAIVMLDVTFYTDVRYYSMLYSTSVASYGIVTYPNVDT